MMSGCGFKLGIVNLSLKNVNLYEDVKATRTRKIQIEKGIMEL